MTTYKPKYPDPKGGSSNDGETTEKASTSGISLRVEESLESSRGSRIKRRRTSASDSTYEVDLTHSKMEKEEEKKADEEERRLRRLKVEKDEKVNKEKAENEKTEEEARKRARKKTKEIAEKEAKEKIEKEKAERKAKETEKEDKRKLEKEAKGKAEREAKEKAAKENKKSETEAREKEKGEGEEIKNPEKAEDKREGRLRRTSSSSSLSNSDTRDDKKQKKRSRSGFLSRSSSRSSSSSSSSESRSLKKFRRRSTSTSPEQTCSTISMDEEGKEQDKKQNTVSTSETSERTNAKSYESTLETTNANRACRVVLGPCTDGLRDVLRHYIPPHTFPNVIKQNQRNLPRLTAVQRDLILPQHGHYKGNYSEMDISLLYILLRNISGIAPHSNDWDRDPDPSDKSLSANIERIRLVRNRCVHSCDPFMSNSDFNSLCSTIRSVMVDLDAFLMNGNKYEKAVDFLSHESMDPESVKYYEEELKKQVEEDTKTREMVDNLKKTSERTNAKSYESTLETTNANRACRVVLGPCTDGLRDVLHHYIPPHTFPNVIKRNQRNLPRLTAAQRYLILPQHGYYTGNYRDMDISLLYILLRNISGITPHSNGWGNDPDPNDRSLSGNIERIRLARNRCVHSCDPFMSNSDFNSIWSTIRSVMVDLDAFLVNGNKYEKAVDFLSHESMDPESVKYYEKELKKQVEEDTKTREIVHNLKRKHDEHVKKTKKKTKKLHSKVARLTKSSIPPNVREQYDIDIQKWKDEDKLYYETHSFPSVMQKVRNQPYVTFVGVPGSGKSATAHHIALKLKEEGYEVVPTKDIRKIVDYGDSRNMQVFVIDDVVGIFGLQKADLNELAKYKENITNPYMIKSRTLMTCREVVFNEMLPYNPFLTREETVIKLHSSDNALNDNDIKQILQKYGLDVNLMSPVLLTSTSRMFPLLCKLFSREAKFKALGSEFFLKPVQCISDELDDMQRHNKLNYATLVLCMLNENGLSKDILKDRNNEHFKTMKSDTLKNCELKSETDAFKFVKALSAMEGTYTKQCGAEYTIIHDLMFEICAYQYGKQFPEQMLQYMSSSYIANYVKPQTSEPVTASKMKNIQSNPQCIARSRGSNNSNEKGKQSDLQSTDGNESSNDNDEKEKRSDEKNNEREESFDLCIRLRKNQYPLLAKRLYKDIQDMELYDVLKNQVLKHPQVCQAFIDVLEAQPYTELKALFLSSQKNVATIEYQQDCFEWSERKRQNVLVDMRLVSELDDEGEISSDEDDEDELSSSEDFEEFFINNVRAISWVIYYGHYRILQFILQQTQEHNEINELFTTTGHCPQQIDTYDKQGSGNNRLIEECRLFLLSCWSGDVQTVRVLLPICKKAINGIGQISSDRDWCDTLLPTPLIAACNGGHVSIVEELVKAGADVNLQDKGGYTPLHVACNNGHVSLVEELVKKGADVNLKCKRGEMPLIIACQRGDMNVVEKLMKAGADVNIQDNYMRTPLIAACRRLNILEELVKAKADVNLQVKNGGTPLIAAVKYGSLSTVKYLVEHGADLATQVVDVNVSAVYLALILNKPERMQYLIQEQNKITPGKFNGNVHLYNCLVDIRHAGVKTDSRDDVVVTDRKVRCMGYCEDLWETIRGGDCDVLRRLLCVGLDANQLIQLHTSNNKFDVEPLLYALIGDTVAKYRADKVRTLLEAGVDVNIRVRYREDDYVTDGEPVSGCEMDSEDGSVSGSEMDSEDESLLSWAEFLIDYEMDSEDESSLDTDDNARVKYRKQTSVLNKEGISVLERMRLLLSEDSNAYDKYNVPKLKKDMCEIKKHVRRHSV